MYPRRFRELHKPLDWPVLIERIANAGWSVTAMSEATGIPRATLSSTKNEAIPHPKDWDKAIALLDLYLRVTDGHNDFDL